LCSNFDKIVRFLEELPSDSAAVEKAKLLAQNDDVKDELFNCATNDFLVYAIEALEKEGEEKEVQWKVVSDVLEKLHGSAKEKLLDSLSKNPDVKEFATIKEPELRLRTRYAPLVSVDVERSFSVYKHILGDRRQSFTFSSIEMHNVIAVNSFLIM